MKSKNNWGILGQNAVSQKIEAFLSGRGQKVVYIGNNEKLHDLTDEEMFGIDYIVYAVNTHVTAFWEEIEEWVLPAAMCSAMPSIFLISTPFPPGTGERLSRLFSEKNIPTKVISFPPLTLSDERKHNGCPTGLVFGVPEEEGAAVHSFRRTVCNFSFPILFMTRYEAEVLAHFYPLYKTEKKHQYNKLMAYCENNGCDAITVLRGMGLDPEIGQHNRYEIIQPADWIRGKITKYVQNTKNKERIQNLCVWNDSQGKHEQEIIRELKQGGYRLQVYNPGKGQQGLPTFGHPPYDSKWEAVCNADAIIILSNSPAFSSIKVKEWQLQKERMKCPLIIDLWGSYEPNELEIAGCRYVSPGRVSKSLAKLYKNT